MIISIRREIDKDENEKLDVSQWNLCFWGKKDYVMKRSGYVFYNSLILTWEWFRNYNQWLVELNQRAYLAASSNKIF